jgi:hypothetical protein
MWRMKGGGGGQREHQLMRVCRLVDGVCMGLPVSKVTNMHS